MSVHDGCYKIYVSTDSMKVFVKFVSNPVDKCIDDIELEVKNMGIKCNVNIGYLEEIIKKIDFNKEYIVAKGKNPIDATPATIEYHFKTERDYKPEIDVNGNVNYHKLNVIAKVKKGQLLATLHPGTEGISGFDVFGKEIRAKKAKVIRLRRGKNVTINDDNTELYAELDGLVRIDDDKVIVNDTYEIPNNVGSSTGDINFDGSIVIHGNVMTGFKVIAKGDIEVMGVVEGAVVKAGGNIRLHKGIQGMNRCTIVAGGDVTARYIENADVISGGKIHSEAILHSKVSAKEIITVEGKKGMISGGIVRSGIEINTNILGSHMGTTTNIQVGIDPIIWEEYNTLLKELPKLKHEAQKLEQIIVLLNKRKELEGELDEQKKNMYMSATRNKIILSNKIKVSIKRIEELHVEVERRNDGRINVRNTIYPGVRVTIGNAKYFVRDELKYVTLIKDGADVKLTALS